MSADEREAAGQPGGLTVAPGLLLATYAGAIFLSAALLFAVQPLFAKMVLPRLGGSPSVWSVAMVFFQGVLLAGYAYAHLITTRLPGRMSVLVHLAVMIAAIAALPLAIASGWGRPPAQGEAFWLLGLFTVSIGLPFFALSANGPLLQAWFARTGHPAAGDPYFLYAASNIGSFLALISYPLVVEPFTRLGQQTFGWSLGFYTLIVLIAACGLLLLRSRDMLPQPVTRPIAGGGMTPAAAPTWRDAALWTALAAVPSGLLIAVTAHLSTDVAAAPFLWVAPLALYLLTFVVVFSSKPLIPHRWMLLAQPVVVGLLVALIAYNPLDRIFTVMGVHVVAFFVLTMVCHGELARRRPPARYLTAFYMWMSFGGVLGGVLAALVAPRLFASVAEYPLLIVLALLCRPGHWFASGRLERALSLTVLAAAAVAAVVFIIFRGQLTGNWFVAAVAAPLVLGVLLARNVLVLATLVALSLLVVRFHGNESDDRDYIRSFFGVYKIAESEDGLFRVLRHGTTEHGAQRIRNADRTPATGKPEPLTYYHPKSPMAQGIAAVRARKQGPLRMAVVGLGTGTLACYVEPGDKLDFYEIDPAVVRIAQDPARFTYLRDCAPDARMIVGDARLTLADAPAGQYDVMVIDAFSSDAIPVHLLTKEAMAIYLASMAPDGVILIHVSNRHMELVSVVAGIASAHDLTTISNNSDEGSDDENYLFSSTVTAVARAEEDFGSLWDDDEWTLEEADEKQWVWTDDYSNIIGAMIRHYRR
jgi:hypothetical protein